MLFVASSAIKVVDALRPLLPMVVAFSSMKIGSAIGGLGGSLVRRGFSEGGHIPGVGNSDSEVAVAHTWESSFLKKTSAHKLGPAALSYMNERGELPKFAEGGTVGIPGMTPLYGRPRAGRVLVTVPHTEALGKDLDFSDLSWMKTMAGEKSLDLARLLNRNIAHRTPLKAAEFYFPEKPPRSRDQGAYLLPDEERFDQFHFASSAGEFAPVSVPKSQAAAFASRYQGSILGFDKPKGLPANLLRQVRSRRDFIPFGTSLLAETAHSADGRELLSHLPGDTRLLGSGVQAVAMDTAPGVVGRLGRVGLSR